MRRYIIYIAVIMNFITAVCFAEVNFFIRESVQIFEQNDKYGLCDKEGGLIAEAIYRDIRPLDYGFIIARSDDSMHLLNDYGQQIYESDAFYVKNIAENRILIYEFQNDSSVILDASGKLLLEVTNKDFLDLGNQCMYYWNSESMVGTCHDLEGNILFSEKCIDLYECGLGFSVVQYSDNEYGIFDQSGKLLNEKKWLYTEGFGEEYANFTTIQDGKIVSGLINTSGEILFQSECEYVSNHVSQERVIFYNKGLEGYKDLNGNTIIKAEWDSLSDYINGITIAVDDVWEINSSIAFDLDGNILLSDLPSGYSMVYGNLIIFQGDNENISVKHRYGKTIDTSDWKSVFFIDAEYPALVFTKECEAYYMDADGNNIFEESWLDALEFTNGFAYVKFENGLWGTIDHEGYIVQSPVFDDVTVNYNVGCHIVRIDENYYWASESGALLGPTTENVYYEY